jgi:HK97 family phage prohead protease
MNYQVVYKASELTKASDGTYEYVASDESVDRYGDVIRVSGWDLKNYRKNPIILFAHQKDNPVGTASKVWIEGTKMMVRIKMADEGTSPFIDTLRKLMDQNIVRAVSVGFLPTVQPNYIRDEKNDMITGIEYVGQELLENSLVTVPANPAALTTAKSMGISESHLRRVFNTRPSSALAHLALQRAVLDMARLGASGRKTS